MMKQIKITFANKIPNSFWEAESIQRMAPTPLFDYGCLLKFPDRQADNAMRALAKWMAEQGYQKYSIEQMR
jgi:hypothetical protein